MIGYYFYYAEAERACTKPTKRYVTGAQRMLKDLAKTASLRIKYSTRKEGSNITRYTMPQIRAGC